jgi:hypothetical protein
MTSTPSKSEVVPEASFMFDSYKGLQLTAIDTSGSVVADAFGVALVLLGRHEQIEPGMLQEGDFKCVQLLQLDSSTTALIFPPGTLSRSAS